MFSVYGFVKILKYKSTLFKFHRHNNLFCYILTFYTREFVLNFLHYGLSWYNFKKEATYLKMIGALQNITTMIGRDSPTKLVSRITFPA